MAIDDEAGVHDGSSTMAQARGVPLRHCRPDSLPFSQVLSSTTLNCLSRCLGLTRFLLLEKNTASSLINGLSARTPPAWFLPNPREIQYMSHPFICKDVCQELVSRNQMLHVCFVQCHSHLSNSYVNAGAI